MLIAVNLLVEGSYYYGNLIGLTNRSGLVAISGDELEKRYRADQARFPMDYRLELIECDDLIEICLLSNAEIKAASEGIAEASDIAPEIRDAYVRARNALFSPALLRAIGDTDNDGTLRVALTTQKL